MQDWLTRMGWLENRVLRNCLGDGELGDRPESGPACAEEGEQESNGGDFESLLLFMEQRDNPDGEEVGYCGDGL